MADDLDKFVLQYQVDLKDSIRRLEELNNKIEATNKKSQEGRAKDTNEAKKSEKQKEDAQKREAKSAEAARAKEEKEKIASSKRVAQEEAKQERARKDAQAKKERAQEEANKKAKKANQEALSSAKSFAGDASDEIAKLVPGVDNVTKSVLGMGTAFGVASAALAVLAGGIGAVMNLKDRYEKQRQTGMDVGVSAPRMEEYQRKFQKYGAGRVSRDQTLENIQKISEARSAAYADPTRMGEKARLMRMIGIDVGKLGEKPIGTNEMMAKLGQKFAGGTEAQAQAIGAQFGLSQDFTTALRKMGASAGKITETSREELTGEKETNKNLDKFNESLSKMNEEFVKAGTAIGEQLLPFLTKVGDLGAKTAKYLPKATEEAGTFFGEFGGPAKMMAGAGGALWDKITGKGEFGESYNKRMGRGEYSPEAISKREQEKKAKEQEKKENGGIEKSVDQIAEDFDRTNAKNKESTDVFQQAINMFSGAVSSFANAVDERQAWAAWAGEVGKAAGLSSPGAPGETPGKNAPPKGPAFSGTTQYDPFFEEAAKRFKVSPSTLKMIAQAESSMNPQAVSSVGAQGLMQVMPENSRKLGVKSPFDPRSNIMAGAEIFAGNLKAAGGDVRTALMMYHGGYDRSAWGAQTLAYPDRVLNPGALSSRGESKANINLAAVQANVAQRLGVDVRQVRQGGISKGDITWTLNQKEAELQNKIIDLNRQSHTANLPKTEYDRIARETQETQMGLEATRKYRGNIEDKAREGGRQVTIGQMPVYVNVTGAGNPEKIMHDVRENTQRGVQDALNSVHDGKKL